MKFKKSSIPENSGRIIVSPHGANVAVFRDANGGLHVFSPLCTHQHCEVKWNDSEKTWDCPCHGARFEATGELKHGPAEKGLHPKPFREEGDEVLI